jgi:uncharacterized protein
VDDDLARRSYVGLSLVDAGQDDGGAAGDAKAVVVVRAVRFGSPAAEAGARPTDRLIAVNGQPVASAAAVRRHLSALAAGAPFALGVVRDGVELALSGTARPLPVETFAGASVRLGIVVARAGAPRLRAIAVIPDGDGPHPVVYFLPGAHWDSEEHPFAPDHPVRALVAALAARGFAVLRVERSGVGDSEGPPCTEVDFETELGGYRAGLELLGRASWASPSSVFLFGHSMGGVVAALLADDAGAAAGSVRGVAVFGTVYEPLPDSLIGIARRRTALLAQVGDGRAAERACYLDAVTAIVNAVVRDGVTPAELYARRPDLAEVVPQFYAGDKMFGRIVRYYQQIAALDLCAAWAKVRAPVLALHGGDDWVATAADARSIAGEDRARRFASLPAVDHTMRATPPAGADGRPRLAESMLAALVPWLEEHTA